MLGEGERKRIALTVSCRDTDIIPKVPDAGQVRAGPSRLSGVERIQVMFNGVLIEEGCYYGEWMTEVIKDLRGHHEPQEELVFHAVLERLAATNTAPVVLELGSFWAWYSLWTLERLPQARSFCVEPDPAYLEKGRRNFELNGREGTFHLAAVGREATPPQSFVCESDGVERQIPFEGLGSLLERWGLERADLVLVDVQGAETALLDGARELLRDGRVRFMVISTHHHVISNDALTHQRCLMLLQELGAHVIAEHTVAESYSGDGLIAVSFGPEDRDLEVLISRCRVGDSWFGDPLWDLDATRSELSVARSEVDALRAQPMPSSARTSFAKRFGATRV